MKIATKLAAFALSFAIGVFSSFVHDYWEFLGIPGVSPRTTQKSKIEQAPSLSAERNTGSGCGGCNLHESSSAETFAPSLRVTKPLRIVYKEKASYTEEARSHGIQGKVTLRVTFLASGGIGSITTIKGLPFGLTEQAVEAVKKIKFEPEHVNGVARTTARPVSFTFNIY